MNVLSCKFIDENGGSFQLLIDGILLVEQVNYEEDSLIPYFLTCDGIPTFPPYESETDERIVAVCCCGEYGCDCITCKIEIKNGFVTFSNFKRPGYSRVIEKIFKFTEKNYHEVENYLIVESKKISKSFENKT